MPGGELLGARVLARKPDQGIRDRARIDQRIHEEARPAHRRERNRRQQASGSTGGRAVHRRWPTRSRTRTRRANATCGTAAARRTSRRSRSSRMRCCGAQPVWRRGAAGLFEREQEFVAQERLCARGALTRAARTPGGSYQGIPVGRIDVRNAPQETRSRHHQACAARGLAWRSASRRSRYLSASSAAMQPVPAEVTACRYT